MRPAREPVIPTPAIASAPAQSPKSSKGRDTGRRMAAMTTAAAARTVPQIRKEAKMFRLAKTPTATVLFVTA